MFRWLNVSYLRSVYKFFLLVKFYVKFLLVDSIWGKVAPLRCEKEGDVATFACYNFGYLSITAPTVHGGDVSSNATPGARA